MTPSAPDPNQTTLDVQLESSESVLDLMLSILADQLLMTTFATVDFATRKEIRHLQDRVEKYNFEGLVEKIYHWKSYYISVSDELKLEMSLAGGTESWNDTQSRRGSGKSDPAIVALEDSHAFWLGREYSENTDIFLEDRTLERIMITESEERRSDYFVYNSNPSSSAMRTTPLLSFCLALLGFSTASPVVAGQHGVVDNQYEAINAASPKITGNSGGGTLEGLPDSGRDSHGNPNDRRSLPPDLLIVCKYCLVLEGAGGLAERCLKVCRR
ncbi:hypothetical protein BKA70DRAFT_1578668 [Coprinopsis sp. MPI-PUGE-AT-0042]|nr:hypothetical protein BKA70DRAFT_1578668 [Coprinopsis sp. MPI-PUGE-AT-0042]